MAQDNQDIEATEEVKDTKSKSKTKKETKKGSKSVKKDEISPSPEIKP